MYEYRVKIIKVVDGDTVDVDIDLGFGITLTDERVRIMGIDTPESRTRDKVEKVFGKAAKQALLDMLGKTSIKVGSKVWVVQKTKKTAGEVIKMNIKKAVVEMDGRGAYNVPFSMIESR